MSRFEAVVTDYSFPTLEAEERILAEAGCALKKGQCKTEAEVLELAREADVVMAQWAPVTASVIKNLSRCKAIVRYGIGVDNVDLATARAKGIPVCNVPDYGIDEVADHAVSLALSLGRQLGTLDRRTREGVWKLAPVSPMPAFREMLFATAGLGRIARSVLERARPFGFRLAAYDPYVADEVFVQMGVRKLTPEEIFAEADILSLHLPLMETTKHFVNEARLESMKRTAIVVNTARGPLVDNAALVAALDGEAIAYAGLDVFESEPLPPDSPLLSCGKVLLTPHVAWYSESSTPKLQRLVAEEAVRALRGETLRNVVNGVSAQ